MRTFYKLVILVICLLTNKPSIAQWNYIGGAEYDFTSDPGFSDEGRKVVMDNAGGVYTISDHRSNINPSGIVTNLSYNYVILRRYDISGNVIAETKINVGLLQENGLNNFSSFGLKLSGGALYFGYTVHDAANGFDVVIAKYTTSLTSSWVYRWQKATSNEKGIDFAVSGSTVYALVESNLNGVVSQAILKANAASTVTVPFYNILNLKVTSIGVDSNLNVILGGYKFNGTANEVKLEKLSPTATQLWLVTYNAGSISGNDRINKIEVTTDGSIYITGTSFNSLSGNQDFLIARYSSNGARAWIRVVNRGVDDSGSLISAATDHKILWVAGTSATNSLVFYRYDGRTGTLTGSAVAAPNISGGAVLINRYELSEMKMTNLSRNCYLVGSLIGKTAGDSLSASFALKITNRLSVTVENGYYIDGSFSNSNAGVSIDFNETTKQVSILKNVFGDFAGHQSEAISIENYGVTSAFKTSLDAEEVRAITTYPNPFKNELHVSGLLVDSKIEIMDIAGRMVLTSIAVDRNHTINTEGLTSGIYLLRSVNEAGVISTDRIVK
jgi:hypothetical protein